MTGPGVVIDGTALTCGQVRAVARQAAQVSVGSGAVGRARAAWQAAQEIAAHRPVYGRTTGVGANRTVALDRADTQQHGLRLLRSHAAGPAPTSPRTWPGPCWWCG